MGAQPNRAEAGVATGTFRDPPHGTDRALTSMAPPGHSSLYRDARPTPTDTSRIHTPSTLREIPAPPRHTTRPPTWTCMWPAHGLTDSPPHLDTSPHPHTWTLLMCPRPVHSPAGPAIPLWSAAHMDMPSQPDTDTQTRPRLLAGSQIMAPDGPPSAAAPTWPTGPHAPTATTPRGRPLLSALFPCASPVPEQAWHTGLWMDLTQTHAEGLASLPGAAQSGSPAPKQPLKELSGLPGVEAPENLPSTAKP